MLAKSGIEVEVSLPSEREIMFTCRFRRPRRLLFSAWTQPEHVREWWGCEGARITGCEIDLEVGGAWKVVMQMADGSEHPFRGVYQEITNEERLEYTEC